MKRFWWPLAIALFVTDQAQAVLVTQGGTFDSDDMPFFVEPFDAVLGALNRLLSV